MNFLLRFVFLDTMFQGDITAQTLVFSVIKVSNASGQIMEFCNFIKILGRGGKHNVPKNNLLYCTPCQLQTQSVCKVPSGKVQTCAADSRDVFLVLSVKIWRSLDLNSQNTSPKLKPLIQN